MVYIYAQQIYKRTFKIYCHYRCADGCRAGAGNFEAEFIYIFGKKTDYRKNI